MFVVPRYLEDPVCTQRRNIWNFMKPHLLRDIIGDFDRQMDRFERDVFVRSPQLSERRRPLLGEIKDGNYKLNIDLSGFKPEDITISVKNGVLSIKGKMEKSEDGSRLQQEFVREFTIPKSVKQSTLKSVLGNDGVLSIEGDVEEAEKDSPREIPIQLSKM